MSEILEDSLPLIKINCGPVRDRAKFGLSSSYGYLQSMTPYVNCNGIMHVFKGYEGYWIVSSMYESVKGKDHLFVWLRPMDELYPHKEHEWDNKINQHCRSFFIPLKVK